MIPEKLTITLDADEGPLILAWLNDLAHRPDMIGKQPDGYVPGTNLVNGQSRIVLMSHARGRAEEIAAQFGVALPGAAPVPSGDFCAPGSIRIDVPWGDVTRYATDQMEPRTFADNAVCVRFTVPANATGKISAGSLSFAEYRGEPWPRHMTLSRHACDFRPADPTGANGPLAAEGGTSVLLRFNVGSLDGGAHAALQAGQTYYFNIRNTSPGGGPVTGDKPGSFTMSWPANPGA